MLTENDVNPCENPEKNSTLNDSEEECDLRELAAIICAVLIQEIQNQLHEEE